MFLHGPSLFTRVSDLDLLKDVIDNLSTPLSLPIAGWKTTMQGTLYCYFRVGNNIYGVTAHHNVFPRNGDNEYNYVGFVEVAVLASHVINCGNFFSI